MQNNKERTNMSNKKLSTTKKGFTIIEVVLVLAIAGLIFLMVFVALPALQRNQRDTQRRQDYADTAAAVIGYASNNGGKLPTLASGTTYSQFTATKFINTSGKDPSGTNYSLTICSSVNASGANVTGTCETNGGQAATGQSVSAPTAGKVYVLVKTKCNNGAVTTSGATDKDFTIYGYMEGAAYCNNYNI